MRQTNQLLDVLNLFSRYWLIRHAHNQNISREVSSNLESFKIEKTSIGTKEAYDPLRWVFKLKTSVVNSAHWYLPARRDDLLQPCCDLVPTLDYWVDEVFYLVESTENFWL